MADAQSEALFACTKCHKRHTFDDLSSDDMLCKDCRESIVTVKCTYCREDFQQSGKETSSSICKKCQHNVKLYGKPSACEYCNIIAAFIGSKCQRCTNSEGRWGSPVACEQCRQRSAFRRPDDSRRKVDGKTLCWLCTLAYKRVLARTRKKTNALLYPGGSVSAAGGRVRRPSSSTTRPRRLAQTGAESEDSMRRARHDERRKRERDRRDDVAAAGQGNQDRVAPSGGQQQAASSHKSPFNSPEKKAKVERSTSIGNGSSLSGKGSLGSDLTLNENMITITRLHEEVEALKKLLLQKEMQLLDRDRKLTEIKARQYEIETELRNKLANVQKSHSETTLGLQAKNKDLLKHIATLSRVIKKVPAGVTSAVAASTGSPSR